MGLTYNMHNRQKYSPVLFGKVERKMPLENPYVKWEDITTNNRKGAYV